jgi:AraC-like DNA-binding protein/Tfp pilus assembly protein PilF
MKFILSIALVFTLGLSKGQSSIDSLLAVFNQHPDQIEVLVELNFEYYSQGNITEAFKYSNYIFDLARLEGNDHYYAKGLFSEVLLFTELGEFDKAFDVGTRALDIFKKNGAKNETGDVLNYLGMNFMESGRNEEAVSYYQQSLDVFEQLGLEDKTIKVNNNLAICENALGEHEKARNRYLYCINHWKKKRSFLAQAKCYLNLGGVSYNEEDYTTAGFYVDSALIIARSINDSIMIGKCLLNRAELDRLNGLPEKAISDLRLSSIHLKGKNLLVQSIVYQLLAESFSDLNKPDSAFFYLKKSTFLKDSVFSQENDQKLSNLKTIYEVEQKENEIELLSAENKIKEKEIDANTNKIFYLSLISISLFMALLIFLFLKRSLNQSNQGLFRKNMVLIEKEELIEKPALSTPKSRIKKSTDKKTTNLSHEQVMEYFSIVNQAMTRDKLFLNTELTLESLAKELEINRSYLSQVINERFGSNFSTYLNVFRVKEARRQLSNDDFKHLSIEGIGLNCGFKSNSAFYKAFKEFTGLTPSYFSKQSRAENS